MNELDLARGIASGDLPSPQHYENLWLFAIRITGTGASYRQAHNEYVWRDAAHYLNDDFLARCNGLPVILEHPESSTLNTEEYHERNVGSVMLPYIKDDEVWAVVRIYDEPTAELLNSDQLSTSPAVVFLPPDKGITHDLGNGEHVLFEGAPSLLDHIAICYQGVWDKAGPPRGVDAAAAKDIDMAEEKKDAAEARDDASSDIMTKLDAICEKLDAAHKRMDALEARDRKDAEDKEERDDSEKEEKREDKARKDAKRDDTEEPTEEREDSRKDAAKKDGELEKWAKEEEKEPEHKGDSRKDESEKERDEDLEKGAKKAEKKLEKEERDDKARKDAERRADAAERENEAMKRRLAAVEGMIKEMSREVTPEDRDALAAAQSRADGVYALFGDRSPSPNIGEIPLSYRRRLLRPLLKHSPQFREAKLDSMDAATMSLVENQVFADAQTASRVSPDMAPGRLIPRVSYDEAGRKITRFDGDPMAWMAPFMTGGQVCRINRNPKGIGL